MLEYGKENQKKWIVIDDNNPCDRNQTLSDYCTDNCTQQYQSSFDDKYRSNTQIISVKDITSALKMNLAF